MKIAVVSHYDVVSHFVNANRIANVFTKQGHECKLYNFDAREVPEENVLYVANLHAQALSYLNRFLPEKKIVFYAVCEGFPIIDPISIEKTVAGKIKIVANSDFTKMCLETVQLPCQGVVPHGLPMNYQIIDEKFHYYVKTWTKDNPTFLCVSGNSERKGLDRYIIASKLVSRELPNATFILHSGEGVLNLPRMVNDLELGKNFWFTNAFGMFHEHKINALYKLCTAYVQPSYCESFCIPLIEAFRFHKPAIAVDAPPMNEIIDKETGILLPNIKVQQVKYLDRYMLPLHLYSVDALADAMIKIAEDQPFRRALIKKVGEKKSKYEADHVYSQLLNFF